MPWAYGSYGQSPSTFPLTRGLGPLRAHVVPNHVLLLWLLPAAVQKVGLSLWGTNTKKINLQMLPQELGEGEVFGAKGIG